jgi:glycosyltransferase involved in cell wall biosynthesis
MESNVTGKLLPVGDVAVWRDTILNLARDEQLRRQLQSNGRDWVGKKFRTEEIAQQFTVMLKEVRR